MKYTEWMAARDRIIVLGDNIGHRIKTGCLDHHCRIHPHIGWGTNGGCRCYRELAEQALELAALADSIKNIIHIPEGP